MDLAPVGDSEATLSPSQPRTKEEPLRACFLSRISPKKNLDFALRVLSKVRSDVVFTIYGPKEDIAYCQACEALIAALPSNIHVVDGGEVHPNNVKARLAEQDLFFLPTRGENYGHVIHEALSAGLPVLISDQTPWQDLEERGVGWALALEDENEFAKQIDHVSAWSAEKYHQTRSTARVYAVEKSLDTDVLESNRFLFSGLTEQS
jgi:glycosyltransferase involved in cell wall biosynthesis